MLKLFRKPLFVGLAMLLVFRPALADGVVVANPSVAVDSVSRQYLLSIFTLRASQWPNGDAITLVVFPDQNPAHVTFVKKTLKLFPYQLRSIWDRYIFSGAAQTPVVVSTREEMLRRVGETEGAIGYLAASPGETAGVRVIEIK